MSPHKRSQPVAPFFMMFPWLKIGAVFFGVSLVMMVIYRLSEAGGIHVNRACLAAMITAMVAGIMGLYAIGKTWGRGVYWVLAGVVLAVVIRLLISGCSFVIILPFTQVHRTWYVLFLGIYYLLFLAVDTWFALWVLRNSELKDQKNIIHGNLWDIIG